MASDAHAHPYELSLFDPSFEEERRAAGIAVLSSAWREEELAFHRDLAQAARNDHAAPVYCAFGVHPQLLLEAPDKIPTARACLESALGNGLLDAIGEVGLDAFGPHRATLHDQMPLFLEQLDCAIHYRLPLVLHLRRASAELFSCTRALKKLPSLILHSSPLTLRESLSLLDRGVNAFFSFGTPLLKGKRSALEAVSMLPLERILLETDAPFQGLGRGETTDWSTLGKVRETAFAMREADRMSRTDFEKTVDSNFGRALCHE